VVAGYEFYPEERVVAYNKDIAGITQRLGLTPARSAGGISTFEMMKTFQQPSAEPYWKLRYKGACEDVFFLTINDKIESMVKTMLDTAGAGGYPATDLGVYLQPTVQGTSVHCEFNLFYDAQDVVASQKVKDLSAASTKALLNNGAFFSRPYGDNTRLIVNRDGMSVAYLNRLKNIFDPNRIMNPGKVGW
jgi:FAD/FMN-containing dehydrogenase